MKYALKQTLEPLKSILQHVSSQEYATIATKIGEQIQTKERRTQEIQEDQIELALELQQQEHVHITSIYSHNNIYKSH